MKKIEKYLFIGILILFVVQCSSFSATAAVPHLINYQGRLTDASGVPLADGTHNITFRIYDSLNGGTLLWEGTYSVNTQKGIFNVLLGDITNPGYDFSSLAFDKPYYLEIKVGDEVMSPRQTMASAPYAMRAEHGVPKGVITMWSGSIANIPSGWALCDGANGTPDLRDKFIVGARQDSSGIAKTNVNNSLTQTGGEATHVLTINEMPAHSHSVGYFTDGGGGGIFPNVGEAWDVYNMRYRDTNPAGGGQAHNILPPYYALAYIMKL